MPSASRVAGMYAWNQLGRKVSKGQKGIRILAPMIGVRRKKESEAHKDITRQTRPVLVGCRAAYVFDVSQTEGAPLPDLSERVKGEVGEYRERLIDFLTAQDSKAHCGHEPDARLPARTRHHDAQGAFSPGCAAANHFRRRQLLLLKADARFA